MGSGAREELPSLLKSSKRRKRSKRADAGAQPTPPPAATPYRASPSRARLNRLRFPSLSPRFERWLGPNTLLWLAILSVLPIFYVGFKLTVGVTGWGWPQNIHRWIDYDYFWHLAAGNWMIDKWEMPTPDPWLFTYDGKFVAHEWLGEVFLSVTYRVGGYPAGIVATWLIAIAGFWLLFGVAHLYGLSWRACVVVSVLWMGVFLKDGVLAVRPQMWAFSFYALLFLILALYETGRLNHLWLLPPFFLIWFNMHLSAVIGIGILGLFGLDHLIHRRPVRHVLVVGVLCVAGVAVNPFGLDYVDQILRFGNRPEMWNQVLWEWQAPVLSEAHNLGFVLSMPMAVAAVWQLRHGRVWPGLLVLIFLYQALTSVRFVPHYVIFCVVFAGWLVWRRLQDLDDLCIPAPRLTAPSLKLLAAPVLVATAITLWVMVTFENSTFRRVPIAMGYPVDAAEIYREKYSDRRLFNLYNWGGFLDLIFNGDPQIYIDGRADTYPNELFERHFYILDGGSGWDTMMNEDRIEAIMIRPTDGLNQELVGHPDWELVYEDQWSKLFVRRSQID